MALEKEFRKLDQKNLKPGGFVAAGLPAIRQHLKTVLRNQPDYFTHQTLNNFLLHNCNKVLSSVGTSLKPEKLDDINIFKRYQRVFDRFKETEFLNDCELMLDSAGYQYQCGLIPKHFVETFVDMYYEFLEKNVGRYSQAFLFDPVPGATQSVVESYNEMEKLNVISYEKASNLSPEVRKSILYIHHFRTPQINKLYKKLLFDYKFADNFENFSTGGMITLLNKHRHPPCNMYVVPLISILKHVKERGLKKFRFHVLGDSDWKSILFHKFVEYHVKKVHNIDIEITYDSTSIQKTFMLSRFLFVPMYEDRSIWKMRVKSDLLHMQWKNKGTVEDYYYELMEEITREYNFKPLNPKIDPIYNLDGKISRISYAYAILQVLKLFHLCGEWSEELVKNTYTLYENGQTLDFNHIIEGCLKRFNNGKMSNAVHIRTSAISKSLDMLTDLDIDYADYLINRYMSVDEAQSLKNSSITRF